MNKFLQKAAIAALLFSGITLSAQNVGINATGAAPDAGALLDISSTNKGLLIPRVSIANLTLIAPIVGSATTSMLVYNTNAGTGLGYYYWDGADWVKFFTGNPLVDNGLYYNAGASRVRMGGPLVENTTVTQGTFQMYFNLNSTGDFNVQDNGTTRFSVRDNGRVTVGGTGNIQAFNVTGQSYFSDDLYLRDGSVTAGDILVRIFDSGDDGIIDIYENNARNIRLHGNGVSVFNEQGISTNDFRVESDARANMFFVDAGTNRIGINRAAPTSPVHFVTTGENVWLTYWENNTTVGALAQWNHTLTGNGNRVAMGVTNYNGSANAASAIIGLSLNGTTTGNGGIGVTGSANNESGTGVEGTLFFSGGYSGWAGYFNADVFSGGNYWGSDRRLKRDIKSYSGALEAIDKINPVTYYYDTEKYPGIGFDENRLMYGFIAQELEQVIPEMVKDKLLVLNANEEKTADMSVERKTGIFKVVNYSVMIPILTQAVKEQQVLIEAQNQKLEELENLIKELQENK
ncbi:MAG: tail fiber domain-containing protein [Flavobacteriales bacterium]|nr:tail fiber domain-containing protein [Flavobacteriales bacterium]